MKLRMLIRTLYSPPKYILLAATARSSCSYLPRTPKRSGTSLLKDGLWIRGAKGQLGAGCIFRSMYSCSTAKMHPSFGRECVHVLFVRTAKMLPSFG